MNNVMNKMQFNKSAINKSELIQMILRKSDLLYN